MTNLYIVIDSGYAFKSYLYERKREMSESKLWKSLFFVKKKLL